MSSKESNDKAKTSKTARVMNLLSKKQDSAPVTEDVPRTQVPSDAAAPAPAPAPAQVPPLLTSLGSDAAVSDQIKDALEDALEEELAPAPAPAPPVPEPTAVPQSPPAPEPTVAQPESPAFHTDDSVGYINVMQVLVEEKAPKYVKMFGLCDCSRCLEDVKALALNHLPPKYVVMDQGDMIPKLTFYEGKYSSDITAQLLQACKKVMQIPHHDR